VLNNRTTPKLRPIWHRRFPKLRRRGATAYEVRDQLLAAQRPTGLPRRPDAGVGQWGFQIVGSSAAARKAVTGRASVALLQRDARPYSATLRAPFRRKAELPAGTAGATVSDEGEHRRAATPRLPHRAAKAALSFAVESSLLPTFGSSNTGALGGRPSVLLTRAERVAGRASADSPFTSWQRRRGSTSV
jgi:hypothetical protein